MTEAQPRTRILLIALAIASRRFLAVGLLLLVALVALLSPPRGRPTGRVPLEFHVLASRARDREAIERATAPDALAEAPKGFRWVEVDDRSDVFGTPGMIFRDGDDDGRVFREVLVKLTPDDLTHEQIDRVYLTQDSQRHPALGMDFNAEGSRRMQALTGSHIPEDGGLVNTARHPHRRPARLGSVHQLPDRRPGRHRIRQPVQHPRGRGTGRPDDRAPRRRGTVSRHHRPGRLGRFGDAPGGWDGTRRAHSDRTRPDSC